MKRLLALILAGALGAAVQAAGDAAHYLLTPAVLEKMKAVQTEIQQSGISTNDDLSGNDSVDVMARKIDANAGVKAALARQGLTPMDCALTVNAVLNAGLYLQALQNGESAKAADMLAKATPEQRANIELLRKAGS